MNSSVHPNTIRSYGIRMGDSRRGRDFGEERDEEGLEGDEELQGEAEGGGRRGGWGGC